MILQFWLGAILLLVIACAVLIFHFVAHNAQRGDRHRLSSRDLLNRNLYEIRLAEIEQDDAQGLIIDKDKMISELQYNLLDDTDPKRSKKESKVNTRLWFPGLVVLILGSVALYWSVGSYQQVANWESVLQRYPALQDELFNDKNIRPSEQNLRDIMLGLRSHLTTQVDDADGWLLYSRLAMVFKDADMALDAIKKAYQLKPNSNAIRFVYIQLKMQGEEYDKEQAKAMLQSLLKEQPHNIEAWSMYAFMAVEEDDFSTAIVRWQKMLTLVDDNSEQATVLHDSIAYAQKQIIARAVSATPNSATIEPTTQQRLAAPVGQTYQVQISIADRVIIPEPGYLFVFAQQVGAKMPIAAVKIKITRFPVAVELSDANSMVAGNKLSLYPEFIIKARISSDGSITSGKWQGQSDLIKTGEKGAIKVHIAQPL
ncbi:c-type cytochrome biogenesis protein CcmI [Psychromonas antarctica]|uniref:c-type cytochrome biogenesis protein CcmI n=1 Tax=Psychromonas antarctica TaxID=67573 RepID=UPI001EE95144|nr:c-type cytochrome biogenesis protein CcmI [Psychromonas antarctica]MCG6199809.1 c-type cytochrome biogenesis protein CcmI [Psychromonas antarctica]